MFNSNCASVPLVASIDGNNGCNNGFGGYGDWIWIILVFALIWGNNGWGNGFGGNGGNFIPYQLGNTYTDAAVQRGFDNQSIINKLNGLENGLCDGFYSTNTNMLNGFHGVDNAICTLGYQTQQGFNDTNVALMQGQNALQAQIADCCCQNREAISQVRYDLATQACDTRNTIQNTTRDIIDNANCNTRAILDFLTNDKISTLTAENQALKFSASQQTQNAFITANQEAQTAELIRRLGRDCPVPAYFVPNPNCCYTPNQLYGSAYAGGCGSCGC